MSDEHENAPQSQQNKGEPQPVPAPANSWSNPAYVCADDTNYATTPALDEDEETQILLANDFRFEIPGSATINGVKVEIWSYGNDPGVLVTHVLQLTKDANGSIVSESRADHNCEHRWSDQFAFQHSGGGPTDLWGFGLNASQVNNSNFGVKFAVENCESNEDSKPFVDYIQMTVWYDDGSGVQQAGPNLPNYAKNL